MSSNLPTTQKSSPSPRVRWMTPLTKIKWIIFLSLVFSGPLLFVAGIILWGLGAYQISYILWLAPLFEVGWLYGLIDSYTSLDVSHGSFISGPNDLGLLFVILGSLITLSIFYILTNYIARMLYKRKMINNSSALEIKDKTS